LEINLPARIDSHFGVATLPRRMVIDAGGRVPQ